MNKVGKLLVLSISLLVAGCDFSGGGIPSKTSKPTTSPTSAPTSEPSSTSISISTSEVPTSVPTSIPTSEPTSEQSSLPTSEIPTSESTSETSEQPTSVPTSETPTSESTTSVPTSELPLSTSSQPEEQHAYIPLNGDTLPFNDYGVAISDETSGYNNRDLLQNYMNECVGSELIVATSAKNCSIQTNNSDVYPVQPTLHFTIGTGKTIGSIMFYFTRGIKKAVIQCCAYHKYYSGAFNSVDVNSAVVFAGETHELPGEVGEEPEVFEFEATYETPVTSLKLANNSSDKGRVFIKSLELYY